MYVVLDPDLEIRKGGWGGGGGSGHPDPSIRGGGGRSIKFCLAPWASVWSKNKGGCGPLDPPLVFVGSYAKVPFFYRW